MIGRSVPVARTPSCRGVGQAVLLALSLAALACDRDGVWPWVAILLAVGGVLILAVTVSAITKYRRALQQFTEATSSWQRATKDDVRLGGGDG